VLSDTDWSFLIDEVGATGASSIVLVVLPRRGVTSVGRCTGLRLDETKV
jgi:hypothetical protein